MGASTSSAVVPASVPVSSSYAKGNTPRTSYHSLTTSKVSTTSTKSIVYKVNKEPDPENAEESLKSICKNDGLRRACLKFCIGCDIDFMFHVFIEATEFFENPSEEEAYEILNSFRCRFEAEHSIQVISRYEWQKMRELVLNPDATCSFDNARATIVTCKQIAVISLSLALDSFLDSAIYENWERNRVKQEMNVLSNAPIRRGLARYGSCPNPRLIRVQNSVAAATAWVSDPDLGTAEKISAFATVFPNILVVDDSTVSVKLSANSIQSDGHVVRTAHNGRAGFTIATRHTFQIIIVDLFMPVMNGFDLIRMLRQHRQGNSIERRPSDVSTMSYSDDMSRYNDHHTDAQYQFEENCYEPTLWKHAPIVIATTADNDDENIVKAFEAGADYFIEKPITISKIADCLL
jgi:CheY-like chemotaxis protein